MTARPPQTRVPKPDHKPDSAFHQLPFLTLPPRQRPFSSSPETGKVCREAHEPEGGRTGRGAPPPPQSSPAPPAGRPQPPPTARLPPQVPAGKSQHLPGEEISSLAASQACEHAGGAASKLESAGPWRTPPCHIFRPARSSRAPPHQDTGAD